MVLSWSADIAGRRVPNFRVYFANSPHRLSEKGLSGAVSSNRCTMRVGYPFAESFGAFGGNLGDSSNFVCTTSLKFKKN
jgi:hypothetical protein